MKSQKDDYKHLLPWYRQTNSWIYISVFLLSLAGLIILRSDTNNMQRTSTIDVDNKICTLIYNENFFNGVIKDMSATCLDAGTD